MNLKGEWKKLALVAAAFAACYFIPVGWARFDSAVTESLHLVREYARQHVLLCLVPAFFIAGGIAVFISQPAVMKYLGAGANKVLAYAVASVSGSILAVCSCTVLPLFAGIYRMGAGIGPATAFLYAGPAINVLAIVLTANALGLKLGLARAVGAILFSIVIGLLMQVIFRKGEAEKAAAAPVPEPETTRPLWKTSLLFAAMVGILVFANWARSGDVRAVFLCCPGGLTAYEVEGRVVERDEGGLTMVNTAGERVRIDDELVKDVAAVDKSPAYELIYRIRWGLVAALLAAFAGMVWRWVGRGEAREWVEQTWGFAKQILPLLLIGVLAAGLLLGRPGSEGLIPNRYVEMLVGDRPDVMLDITGLAGTGAEGPIRAVWPVLANLAAAVAGAFMYFATLTEVPIVQGLMRSGMGSGPALALLLAGPALSLPNMLVIRSIMGTRKTVVYILLVVVMATLSGLLFGATIA